MSEMNIPPINSKPTLKKPTDMGKKFEKKFDVTMQTYDVALNELDNTMLNERDFSEKRKIWDLAKMEALVHSDPKLSTVYDNMADQGQEKYGYHYNETIMNLIFNKYVLGNSKEYKNKYNAAIPVEKKRRDKSGINQLEKELRDDRDNTSTEKKEVKEDIIDNNGMQRDGEGDFDDRDYLNHRIEKSFDTTSNTMDEHHFSSREDKTNFILQNYDTIKDQFTHMNGNVDEYLNGLSDQELDNVYVAIEKEMGMVDETTGAASSGAFAAPLGYQMKKMHETEELDETSTSSSSGSYETKFAWAAPGKQRHSKNPAWDGGEIIGESTNYLTDSSIYVSILEGMNSPNDDSRVSMAEVQLDRGTYEITSNDTKSLLKLYNAIKDMVSGVQINKELTNLRFDIDQVVDSGNVNYLLKKLGMENNVKRMNEYNSQDLTQLTKGIRRRLPLSTLLAQFKDNQMFNTNPDVAVREFLSTQGVTAENLYNLVELYLDDLNFDGSNPQTVEQATLVDIQDALFDMQPSQEDEQQPMESVTEAIDSTAIVQYDSERSGETPFELRGEKWQYVNGIYPDGRKDIAVYKFGHDLAYSYDWFRSNVLGENVSEAEVVGNVSENAGAYSPDPLFPTENWIGQYYTKDLYTDGERYYDNNTGTEVTYIDIVNKWFEFNGFKPRGKSSKLGEAEQSIIDQNPTSMSMNSDNPNSISSTMKDVEMAMESVVTSGNNPLKDFGISKTGIGGSNGKGDSRFTSKSKSGNPEDKLIEPKKMENMSENDSEHDLCEGCGSPLDEDGFCRKDEMPVAGKIKGEKGACKKKVRHQNSFEKGGENKYNEKFRKERETNYEKKVYDKEKVNNKNMENKQKHSVSEDKKPSALVQLDRIQKDNAKNFNTDIKTSNSSEIAQDQAKLRADDNYTEVTDPYKLGQEIEAEILKLTGGEALKNVGDSANKKGDEIPKRNLSQSESDQVDLDRGLGMQDIVYDNEPSDKFKERMKDDMGEDIYNFAEKKKEYRKNAPMYNKDPQPVQDAKIKTTQYNKFNESVNESVTGKYVDGLGKKRILDFRINECDEVESIKGSFYKVNLDGMGNTYDSRVNENVNMRDFMNTFDFYFNGSNKVVKVKKGKQSLVENVKTEKQAINGQLDNMKRLWGYSPSKHMETKNTKKNRGF